MEFHPISECFPLIEGVEFDELVKDILANGLIHPISVYEGKILDGRNRFLACEKAGGSKSSYDSGKLDQIHQRACR